jgi:hypothetical protein
MSEGLVIFYHSVHNHCNTDVLCHANLTYCTATTTQTFYRQTLLGRDIPPSTTAATAASPVVAEFSEQIARLSELVIDAKALVHHTRHFFDAYAQLHREGAGSRGEAIRGLDSQCYQVCFNCHYYLSFMIEVKGMAVVVLL